LIKDINLYPAQSPKAFIAAGGSGTIAQVRLLIIDNNWYTKL